MSRTDRSPFEVTQRRFAPLLVVRHSTFSLSFVHVAPCSPYKCACHFHLESVLIRFFLRFSLMARMALTRFHLQRPVSKSNEPRDCSASEFRSWCRLEQRWNWSVIKKQVRCRRTPTPGTAVERSTKTGGLSCANSTAEGPFPTPKSAGKMVMCHSRLRVACAMVIPTLLCYLCGSRFVRCRTLCWQHRVDMREGFAC